MSRGNKSRSLEWGSANRPKTSNSLSLPNRSEGSDGDIQISQTNLGAKLFGKLGGEWHEVPLSINGVTKFGTSLSNYLSIDRDSIDIIKESKNVASFGASMRVGEDSTSKSALRVAVDGSLSIGVKDGTAQFSVAANGDCTFGGDLSTAIDLSGLTESAIAAGDYFIFFDGGSTGATRKDNINDLASLFAGAGLTASSSVIAVDDVALGSKTSGNYVATITGGTGLTSSAATSGEGTTHSLSVDASQTQITAVGNLGKLVVDTTTLVVNADSYTDRVGIGTATPISKLEIEDGLTTTGAVLTLGTKETTVVTNDVLGRINFYAPLEDTGGTGAGGGDQRLVGASIVAFARENFSNINNSTGLYFQTGTTAVAETRMVIDQDGLVGIGTYNPDKTLEINSGANDNNHIRLAYNDGDGSASVYADISCTSGGNLALAPTGDITLNPTGADVLPNTPYHTSLGSTSKKMLRLYAAELKVDTLVAADVMATIGGRIIVAPTTELTADLGSGGGDTTITVKHNNIASGDILWMESGGNYEAMKATSSAGGSSGAYTYTVTRGLSSSGRDAWVKGDAVVNTGATGDGWIDMYSDFSVAIAQSTGGGITAGDQIKTNDGPTILGNVRTGVTNFYDYEPMWAIGNLDGHYGEGSDVAGVAIGQYSAEHLIIKSGSIKFRDAGATKLEIANNDITMYANNGTTIVSKWDDHSLQFGADLSTATNVDAINISSDGVKIYGSASTNFVNIDGAGVTVQSSADDSVAISASGITLRAGAADVMTLDAGNISMTGQVILMGAENDPLQGTYRNLIIGNEQVDVGVANVFLGGRSAMASYEDNGASTTSYSYNTCVGWGAGMKLEGDNDVSVNASGHNTLIGMHAFMNVKNASYCTAIGASSMYSTNMSEGFYKSGLIGIGSYSCWGQDGASVIGIGASTGRYAGATTDHVYNIWIGSGAGGWETYQTDTTVIECIAIGHLSGTGGDYGIAIGSSVAAAANDFSFGKASNVVTNSFDTDAAWSRSSDVRKKRNINNSTLGLSFIDDLRPVTFQWKPAEEHPEEWHSWIELMDTETCDPTGEIKYPDMNTESTMHGLIAQEVKAALDNAGVTTFGGWSVNESGQQSLSSEMFVFPLIKAIQELSAKVDTMQEEINNLKAGA